MSRRFTLALAFTATACAVERSLPPPSAPPSSPPRETAPAAPADPAIVETFRNDCLACHTEDLVRQQRLTPAQWKKTIDKMHTWGAPTEPENLEALTAYLASSYAPGAGPYSPENLSVERAQSRLGALPDGPYAPGDRERGRALYADRCAPCHAEDGRGGENGVALAGRHALDRATDFAAVVRAGRGRMPGYEDSTDVEIGDLLAYLRSLTDR